MTRRSSFFVLLAGLAWGLAAVSAAWGTEENNSDNKNAATKPAAAAPLRGPWKVKDMVSGGVATPGSELGGTRIVFDEKTFVVRGGSKDVATMAYKLDPTAKPAAIDMTADGETSLGVYEFAKGRLRIRWNEPGKPRPTNTGEDCDGRLVLAPFGIVIEAADIKTGETRMLVDDLTYTNGGSPEWSRDGRRLALDGWRSAHGEDLQSANILVCDADGKHLKPLGPGVVPTWSPDGKQMGYSCFEPRGVCRMNADGTNRTLIDAEGWGVKWRPKGNQVAYTVGGNIRVRDLDKNTTTMLLDEPYQYVQFGMSWSPDGQWICFRGDREGGYDLAVVRAEGQKKGFRVLLSHDSGKPKQPQFARNPSWSPDGKRMILPMQLPEDKHQQLYLIDVEGKAKPKRLEWQRADCSYSSPVWSPDGRVVAYVRGWRTAE